MNILRADLQSAKGGFLRSSLKYTLPKYRCNISQQKLELKLELEFKKLQLRLKGLKLFPFVFKNSFWYKFLDLTWRRGLIVHCIKLHVCFCPIAFLASNLGMQPSWLMVGLNTSNSKCLLISPFIVP